MDNHGHSNKDFRCHEPAPEPVGGEGQGARAAYCALEQRRLIFSMAITGVTMLLEVAGGLWSGSLALMSDAGHMFSHLFALGVSYCAILLSCRPPTESQSFGFYRAEILAALANGIALLVIVAWILYEAWGRVKSPGAVSVGGMLAIAAIGLAVNIVTALLLKEASRHDINIRGAFMHVMGDMISSMVVVLAAVAIWWTGWTTIDSIASVLIAVVILYWAAGLLWDAVRILLQSTPRNLSHERISAELIHGIPEIHGVHHIHVWELTSRMYVMTAHVEVDDMPLSAVEGIKRRAMDLLAERLAITHANLEFEAVGRPAT